MGEFLKQYFFLVSEFIVWKILEYDTYDEQDFLNTF